MLKIFNSLTKRIEELELSSTVKMYTCGPTVYSYPTIGNWRTYVLSDLINRVLRYEGKEVDLVMNLTDVGHLTGDNEGDADTGEDRLEKAAANENKTAQEVAKFYSDDFLLGFSKMNMLKPKISERTQDGFARATDFIPEQIKMVEEIEEKGFAYVIADGVYFSVGDYEKAGNTYGELSNLDEIMEGARVEVNLEKKDPRDFALWKFSPKNEKRDMEWESKWGRGFPGWHIECSAMSRELLGPQLDIHVGGEDLRSTHHPNEIAQSEAATGKKPFVKYWVHGVFLLVDGKRMGKSMGNAYTLADVEDKSFSLMALKYLYLSSHYRSQMNFTWEALGAAQNALEKLLDRAQVFGAYSIHSYPTISEDRKNELTKEFRLAVEDDLNMPMALAAVWRGLEQTSYGEEEMFFLEEVDKVLGLGLKKGGTLLYKKQEQEKDKYKDLIDLREKYRSEKNWVQADKIRNQLAALGYEVKDK